MIVRPIITQDPVNTTVSEGNTVTLTCLATGDPAPMVRECVFVCVCVYVCLCA